MNNLRRRILKTTILGSGIGFGTILNAGKDKLPSYLSRFRELYRKDPRTASRIWFKQAKFGMFVHYALASLLPRGKVDFIKVFGDKKYPKNEDEKMAVKEYKEQKKRLFKQFTADKFNAESIVDLAVNSGMKYVTFTTCHLGRMYMYDSPVSDFSTVKAPARRDLVDELAVACRKKKLGLFLYVPPETARTDKDYQERNRRILRHLLTKYGALAGIWFDGISKYKSTPDRYKLLSETYSYIRSLQPQCLISFKEGALGKEDFVSPEHFLLTKKYRLNSEGRKKQWEMRLARWKKWNQESDNKWEKIYAKLDAEINSTMQECINRDAKGVLAGWINDNNARHLSDREVLFFLETANSSDANLLMNIGPLADGSVHPDDNKALLKTGDYIDKNGYPIRKLMTKSIFF